MTNYEHIQSLPMEKFAELLLKKIPKPVSPFPEDNAEKDNSEKGEEWRFSERQEFYETSDHRFYKPSEIDKAIKHEIEWLCQEKSEGCSL